MGANRVKQMDKKIVLSVDLLAIVIGHPVMIAVLPTSFGSGSFFSSSSLALYWHYEHVYTMKNVNYVAYIPETSPFFILFNIATIKPLSLPFETG